MRDAAAVRAAARDVTEIYHLAAQVAVTTSVDDPRTDFEVNALGTFNVLEAARRSGTQSLPPVHLDQQGLRLARRRAGRGARNTLSCRRSRLSRASTRREPLDFHSPYGCSKGAADQYVRDYARIYDLPTVVFRMSCIAGPRQFGNEDQGWVAHFLYSVLGGQARSRSTATASRCATSCTCTIWSMP